MEHQQHAALTFVEIRGPRRVVCSRGSSRYTAIRSGSSMCSIRRNARSRSRSSSLGGAGRNRPASFALQSCPAVVRAPVDVDGVTIRLRQEARERRLRQRLEIVAHRSPLRQSCGISQVSKHDLPALTIQLDVTSRGRNGNPASICTSSGPRRRSISATSRRSKRNWRCCCPIRSITVRYGLWSARRRPRPSCCVNTVALSVGRSSRTVSTVGTSTPSPRTSTEKIARSSPTSSLRSACTRSFSGV